MKTSFHNNESNLSSSVAALSHCFVFARVEIQLHYTLRELRHHTIFEAGYLDKV